MSCTLDLNTMNPNNSHDEVMTNIIEYNNELELFFQEFTEYEDVGGVTENEFILQQQELYYTILGTTSALLYLYNGLEQYEKSAELYNEMKRGFLLIFNRIFPATDNEQKFIDLIDKMFETYKTIF
jgi:hypothetical protein